MEKNLQNLLDFEKLKYCYDCGICTGSCPVAELLPETYNPRRLLTDLKFGKLRFLNSPELWLCAWCNRCFSRCPQGISLPEIFQTMRKFAIKNNFFEGLEEALKIIKDKIPLPSSCYCVCFYPERVLKDKETIKKLLKKTRFQIKSRNKKKAVYDKSRSKVAVIGSGPAGLSTAKELVNKGYHVTVFETRPFLGGMLRRCIPKFRLPKKFVDYDVKSIRNLGVEFKNNHSIGENLEFDWLLQNFAAIFIATGAHHERNLSIAGEDLDGVFYGLDFLEKTNFIKLKINGKVIVIGGGDVAIDCARVALRSGAKEVTVLYRRSKEEMPATTWDIKEALDEGVKIKFLVSPKKIIGKKDSVVGIECVKNKLTELDKSGRKYPSEIPNSEFRLDTDYVIISIGQIPDIDFLPKNIEIGKNQIIAINPFTFETNVPGVFAGGDVATGAATLIEAIAAGIQVANTIDCYIAQQTIAKERPKTLEVKEN